MLTDVKVCSKCGEGKSPEEFSRDKRKKDGRRPDCKACASAHYQANKDKITERQRAYYQANKEKHRRLTKAWREANPDKAKEISRAYYEANKERINKRTGAYAKVNRDRKNELARNWNRANPDKIRRRNSNSRAKFPVPQRWVRSECSDDLCYWCGTDLTELDSFDVTLEHIMPFELGGEALPHNEVMSCRPCNSKKKDKHPLVWLALQF